MNRAIPSYNRHCNDHHHHQHYDHCCCCSRRGGNHRLLRSFLILTNNLPKIVCVDIPDQMTVHKRIVSIAAFLITKNARDNSSVDPAYLQPPLCSKRLKQSVNGLGHQPRNHTSILQVVIAPLPFIIHHRHHHHHHHYHHFSASIAIKNSSPILTTMSCQSALRASHECTCEVEKIDI